MTKSSEQFCWLEFEPIEEKDKRDADVADLYEKCKGPFLLPGSGKSQARPTIAIISSTKKLSPARDNKENSLCIIRSQI